MCKNLVSEDLLNKKGFKLVYEFDEFVMSKNSTFVGQGYFCNGMIKLNIINNVSSAYMVDYSILWHDILGHVNYTIIKNIHSLVLTSH